MKPLAVFPSSLTVVPHVGIHHSKTNLFLISLLRGGGDDDIIKTTTTTFSDISLERVSLRLEGLDTYIMICAIILSAIMDVYHGCETKLKTKKKNSINNNDSSSSSSLSWSFILERIAQYIHAFGTTIAVVSTLYVIVSFSLFNLYAKTAIGMQGQGQGQGDTTTTTTTANMDAIYVQFLLATAKYRHYGFHAFLLSLTTFEIAFVANIFLNFQGPLRWIFSGMATIGTILCWKEWNFVVSCASKFIYK